MYLFITNSFEIYINKIQRPKIGYFATPPKRQARSEREWSHFKELGFLVKLGGVCMPECQRDAWMEAK